MQTRTTGSIAAVAACAAMLSPAVASAEESDWRVKAEAGLVAARGNTNTDTANAKLELGREFETWTHGIALSGIYASDEKGATAQRWDVRWQSDYKFHPQGFWFGSARYEDDRFAGFEYQASYGTGLGWRFFDETDNRLVVQLGVGYKVLQRRDTLADDDTVIIGERESDAIVQMGVNFERALTDTTKIINKTLAESGAENTFGQNALSLEVKIMTSLSLAVGYVFRYNTDPPEGFQTTDRLTTLSLVYELK